MKKTNQEIDYVQAVLAMRTMLSLNSAYARKLEMGDPVSLEIINYNCTEKSLARQT